MLRQSQNNNINGIQQVSLFSKKRSFYYYLFVVLFFYDSKLFCSFFLLQNHQLTGLMGVVLGSDGSCGGNMMTGDGGVF
jgi:hypothetical protein